MRVVCCEFTSVLTWMWIRCFTLLFCYCFWMHILLSPMLCMIMVHKVLSWDLGLSVLDALFLCRSICEEDAVKGNRNEVGRNGSQFLLQPSLKTMAATAHPAVKGANVLFLQPSWRWIPHPCRQAKIFLRAFLGRAALGLPHCLLLRYSFGHWLLALRAACGFWGELGFISSYPPAWAAGVGLHPAPQMKHCMGNSRPYCKQCHVGLAQLLLNPRSFISGCS